MDQSRPRPRHERPLIIERPDLAHPLRRTVAFVLTVAAWVGFAAMWLPIFGLAADALGFTVEFGLSPGETGVLALRGLLQLFPVAIALIVLVLVVNGAVGLVFRHIVPERRHRFVGMDQLATGMALDVEKLKTWQSGRILHVEHGPLGRVTDARVVR